jgi:hypothetical protein
MDRSPLLGRLVTLLAVAVILVSGEAERLYERLGWKRVGVIPG